MAKITRALVHHIVYTRCDKIIDPRASLYLININNTRSMLLEYLEGVNYLCGYTILISIMMERRQSICYHWNSCISSIHILIKILNNYRVSYAYIFRKHMYFVYIYVFCFVYICILQFSVYIILFQYMAKEI